MLRAYLLGTGHFNQIFGYVDLVMLLHQFAKRRPVLSGWFLVSAVQALVGAFHLLADGGVDIDAEAF